MQIETIASILLLFSWILSLMAVFFFGRTFERKAFQLWALSMTGSIFNIFKGDKNALGNTDEAK